MTNFSWWDHNKSKAFSRDQILDNVWGSGYFGSDRVVDDLMRRLRQKMPNLSVETIYGYGYRLLVWKRIIFQLNYYYFFLLFY